MYDILVLGSINMDVVVKCSGFPKSGDNVFCESIRMIPGGKGNNQAVSAARYGKKVCFIGCVGEDSAGRQLRENLKSRNVSDSFMLVTKEHETGSCVAIVEQTGDNTLLVKKGANFVFGETEVKNIFDRVDGKILLIQMETSKESVITAMRLAKEKGMYVILDPAPIEGITVEAFQYADLIIPNSSEAQHITGIEVVDTDSAFAAAKKIHESGAPEVIVKRGGDGSLIYKDGEATVIDALAVKTVDTIGAGDCFAGALANALIDNEDLISAVKFANVAAGIKVSRFGGHDAIPSLAEINKFIKCK